MAANICIIFFFTFALFYIESTRATTDFLDQVTRCCQHGIMETMKNNRPNCQNVGLQAQSRMNLPGLVCRTSAELCCVKQVQEKLCNKGKQLAIEGGKCSVLRSQYYGREDHQECCYCCYMGMEAKRKNMGCARSVFLGYPCQKSFSSCCLMENPHPSGMPDIFGTVDPTISTSIITSTPRSRRTCSSLRCSQTCSLLRGVPTCACRNGFQISRNGRTCDDINECSRSGTCSQNERCANTYGSYNCFAISPTQSTLKCAPGLVVDSSGLQCQDVDECQQSPCQAAEECENTRGSYRCNPRCPSTYVFRNDRCQKICNSGSLWDGTRCVDENECLRPGICPSNQRCQNTVGSYRCVSSRPVRCNGGFEKVGQSCVDINECEKYSSRRLCGSRLCVNTRGGYRCSKNECAQGYEMVSSRCRDINECNRQVCARNEECINTAGSYTCNCLRGYERVGSQCQDKNECNRSPCRGRNVVCVNIPASYRCSCKRGYERNGPNCNDINECNKNLCAADETCTNKPGTYRCDKKVLPCQPGFRLSKSTCVDVNECLDKRRCSADEECINTAGSYLCRVKCSQGYERVQISEDCRDIDECNRRNGCRPDQQCENLPGSYRCNKVSTCSSGYRRFRGRCEDINECLIHNACPLSRPVCENIPGSYRCNYRPCQPGFVRGRDGRCRDIDECRTGQHICKDRAEECINLNGAYSCRCNRGYIRTTRDGHCRDKDECRGPDQYCAHKCVNTEGSFKCECRKGYTLVGRTNCYDINECRKEDSGCDHNCVNTQGSFVCRCNRGYTLHSNERSCIDVDECSQSRPCYWRCSNSPGSFRCLCPQGFNVYGRDCFDINECEAGFPCGRVGTSCVNTEGGYKCLNAICPNNLFIKRSATHCARKNCQLNDPVCRSETRKSIRWFGRGLPHNAKSGSFVYLYNITTSGYRVKPKIKFSIKKGNQRGDFEVLKLGYGKSQVRNRRSLTGPRNYQLEYVGEVIDSTTRQVTAVFVTNIYVYVSKDYKFKQP